MPELLNDQRKEAALLQVAQFVETLYKPEKTEASSFVKDLMRSEPTFNGKKIQEFLAESLSKEALDKLMTDLATNDQNSSLEDFWAFHNQLKEETRDIYNNWSQATQAEKITVITEILEYGTESASNKKRERIAPYIASHLQIDNATADALTTCWNQTLPYAATFTQHEKTTTVFSRALGDLGGLISGNDYKADLKKNANGDVVLTITLNPKIFSATLDREGFLGEIQYEYTLKTDTNPPSFVLTRFECANKNYEALLVSEPPSTAEEKNVAMSAILHDLACANPKSTPSEPEPLTGDALKAYITTCRQHNLACDLSGLHPLDFSNTDLRGVDLSNLELSGANFSGANLSDADLFGANLSNAKLTGTNLSAANMGNTILCGANLTGATLTGVMLTGMTIDAETNFSQIVDHKVYTPLVDGEHKIKVESLSTTCDAFHFKQGDAITSRNTTQFLYDFKTNYAPPRTSMTVLLSPKDTAVTRLLAQKDTTDGFKLFSLFAHAEEKTALTKDKNQTLLALEKTLKHPPTQALDTTINF